ncbi:hypothetical protein AB3N04_00395 (plasmid) [Alkalihalophilus sp. As8PL]|uniref:Uncharacterized protein n=1 Tax=Alkalihalophilus sp. As8PL TaxID=3237103 RepID=A0AB39BP34_9BACI
MEIQKREDCYHCKGTGKVPVIPWDDRPVWERMKEEIIVDCDMCEVD